MYWQISLCWVQINTSFQNTLYFQLLLGTPVQFINFWDSFQVGGRDREKEHIDFLLDYLVF